MLSEKRMMAIATEFNYELRHWEGPQTKDAHVAIFMRAIRLAVAETAEACARECERRAEERFDEYGTREGDTGATYYTGSRADEFETKDEEAEDCAAAIREKAREGK